MESSHDNSGSAKKLDETNDYTNLHQVKDIDVRMAPCGSCEGCSVTEDCGTRCENCVQNYIQTAIENNTNTNSLSCLKRICLARNIDIKRETVVVRNGSIKDEQEMKPNQIETKMEILILEKDNTVTVPKMKFNETEEMKEISRSMELGETGFKKSMKWDETSSENNLAISEGDTNDREASNVEMCGICLGCITDCGDCWTCIQRELVATQDLTPKMICQKKKCLSVKEGIDDEIKKEDDGKVKYQRRKRCGTCPGCLLAQNCGNCAPCVRRQRATIEGTRFKVKDICNARKCHALKITKSKKIGQLNSKPFQSNKIYGLGIKIKPKMSKSDKKIDQKKVEVDDYVDYFASEDDHLSIANDSLIDIDQLTLDQTSKLNKVDKWLNENVQFEENLDTDKKDEQKNDVGTNSSLKLANFKSVKRTKKCGECSSCQAEVCGHCRSCQINDQFSDSLVLGKVPCLTNICEFPVELTGDMDAVSLMSLQDDSSNGTVCPVKIVSGVLYDFRCFFCKKLPRVGSANRSELMRHYSTIHYAKQLRKDFEIFMVDCKCLLCGLQLKSHSFISHIGQKHNEVVNYLPPEAVALCPEVIQNEQMGGRRHQGVASVSSQTRSAEFLDWPQVPKGFDPSSEDRNWKGSTSSDPSEEAENNYEIVDGWIIKHVTNSDEELPRSNDPTLDYSGVGGRCSVCKSEFDEVTDAALHLHEDHDIKGGSSYLKDCQNFINSGFIQVSKVQNEIPPATVEDKPDEKFKSSPNSDGYLDFEAKRYVAKKSTSRKSRSYLSPMKEQITRGNSQNSSSSDEETSAHCDEIGMELLPATIHDKADEIGIELLPPTIHDKADENSTPSSNSDGYFMYLDFESKRYVAWQSTGQKYRYSTSPMKEQITRGTFQHSSSNAMELS